MASGDLTTPNRPRYKSENEVWDINLLMWVAMQQPVVNAGNVTVSGTISQGAAGSSAWLVEDVPQHITNLDFVGGANPIYIGLAPANSATSNPVWQIRKFTYDGLSNPSNIQFAGGTPTFSQIWDNRAGLSYS